MIVNPDVDAYTITDFTGKYYEKRKKYTEIYAKYIPKILFAFSFSPWPLRQWLLIRSIPLSKHVKQW